MTEMLICLPAMVLLWAGVDYFRMGYARRLETLSQSHADAWSKAYSNDGSCYGSGGGPWSGWPLGDLPTDNGGSDSIASKFDSSMFLYGVSRSDKSMPTSSARWSGTVTSHTSVLCNEVVPTDDRNVLTPLVDFVKSFL